MKIRCSIKVDCSPERLWAYLEDPEKLKLWTPGLQSVEPEKAGTFDPGSVVIHRIGRGDRVDENRLVVTAREPGRHLGYVQPGDEDDPTDWTVDYRLTDLFGRTRLDYLSEGALRGGLSMKLVNLFCGWMLAVPVMDVLKVLKALAEAEERAAVPPKAVR